MSNPARTRSPQEIAVLQALGVPDEGLTADRILIYDQAAHLDYDWLSTFLWYYETGLPWGSPVKDIYDTALTQMSADDRFRYSTCEMAYLRHFVQDYPGAAAAIAAAGRRFTIVGGGITSPDNLLSSGEAFIRNYLLGKLWLAATLPELLPLRAAWIPDDFGHDPELPATLAALGLTCAAFERVPGTTWQAQDAPLIAAMYQQGVDFRWAASDGSRVLARFLQGGYGQGAKDPIDVQSYIDSYSSWQDPEQRGQIFPMPYGAPTPYLYVPADDDFALPLRGLAGELDTWNQQQFPTTGVWAVPGSFLDFAALVEAFASAAPTDPLTTTLWDGTPYWTGYYASRPQLKVWHYGATRDLLAAEAVGVLAAAGADLWQQVSATWQELAPSTHHDYICGTAADNPAMNVYGGEQVPQLGQAARDAAACAAAALDVLAGAVAPFPVPGETGVVLANPLGVNAAGLAELPGPAPAGVNGFRQDGDVATVQATYEGGLLFPARAPSVGFATGTLTSQAGAPGPVTLTESGGDVWMENESLRVRISPAAPCSGGIAELTDKATGLAVLAPGGVGNDVVIYNDSGNVYQMGYEFTEDPTRNVFAPASITFGQVTMEILERGTLRARVRTTVPVTPQGDAGTYPLIREYALGAGEPFLRMATTSTAPPASAPQNETAVGWTVTAAFPLASPVDALMHGTPNHWTSSQGQQVWEPPVFRATHRFLLPQSNGQTLAAVYHPEVPAWAWDGNGVLLGCINRSVAGFPVVASEPEVTQTVRYALRVPSGLGAPETGLPLAESLLYASPTMAAFTRGGGTESAGWSFATVTGGAGTILAVKPGDVAGGTTVLRLYQPTNGTETVEVTLGRAPASVIAVTALEDPIPDGGPAIQVSANVVTITMENALATVQITWPDAASGERRPHRPETARRQGCLASLLGIGAR